MEIERSFVIKDTKELKRLKKQLEKLGFEFKTKYDQYNFYLDFDDMRLYNEKKHLRLRHNPEFSELSFSEEVFDENGSSIREQISLNFSGEGIINDLRRIFFKIGLGNLFWIIKIREEYGLVALKKNYSEDLHIEIDTSIEMKKRQCQEITLEDTFQICIDTTSTTGNLIHSQEMKDQITAIANEKIDGLVQRLGLSHEQLATKSYFKRYELKTKK